MKIVAFAGGVGGAKLADGLAQILPPESLTIIVNTGDDFEHYGLAISPDVDTVCYTLAGMANPETGWGLKDETFRALRSAAALGGPEWFALGDKDLGTHLERTRRLRAGESLSAITAEFCRRWGVGPRVIPMSDDPVRTKVLTSSGELPFQEYFVHQRCEPPVRGFRFEGASRARPAPGALDALRNADAVIFCPSNPWVSIDPILNTLSLPPFPQKADGTPIPVLAVSPIIGGKALKGPAAKMYAELGIHPSAQAVARHYRGFLSGFVLDVQDASEEEAVRALGMKTLVVNTVMRSREDRKELAKDMLHFAKILIQESNE
jgi:LPPG:FO 2-phospho-L-lactate transferase